MSSKHYRKLALTVLFVFVLFFGMPLSRQVAAFCFIFPNNEANEATEKLWSVVGSASMEEIISLIQDGADVNAIEVRVSRRTDEITYRYSYGATSLMLAASQNPNPDVLRVLIKNGADVNAVSFGGRATLMYAVSNSNPDILRFLIEKGADVNAAADNGSTPLMMAVRNNANLDVLRVLIESGADVNATDERGSTPLTLAAMFSNADVLRLLIESGADVNSVGNNEGTLLRIAAALNPNYDALRVLIEKGVDVNIADNEGVTPLMRAARRHHSNFVRILLEHGADVKATDKRERTALMHTAYAGGASLRYDVVRALLEHGADVNVANNYGKTPLMSAITLRSSYILKTLIRKGADVNAADNIGMTPLMHATATAATSPDLMQILIANGADVNAVDNHGRTSMMILTASRFHPIRPFQALIRNGADFTMRDNEGKLALDHAEANERLRTHYRRTVRVVDDVDLDLFHPWSKATRLSRLDSPASLRVSGDFPRLDGATSAYPIYAAVANEVFDVNSKEELRRFLSVSRTEEAYNRLIRGEVDMIFVLQPSEEQLKAAEEAGVELHFTPIARDGFVFFVNSRNPVSGLPIEQIRDIYRNNITNWHEVGGNDRIILPIQRPANSGSQTAMINEVMQGEELPSPPMEWVQMIMAAAVQAVAQYQNQEEAIGYSFRFFTEEMMRGAFDGRNREADYFRLLIDLIPADAPDATERRERYEREIQRIMNPIQLLAVDGVYPSKENLRNGTYPFTVDVFAVTAGTTNPHVQDIIDWLLSPQGQELIEKTGYVGVGGT